MDNGIELYFSYKTLIAVRDPWKEIYARLPNRWGPTTGRHFRELGCADFDVVEEMPIVRAHIEWRH